MASVLALVARPRLRGRIRAGVRSTRISELVDEVRFASRWEELGALAERSPGSPAFVDPFQVAGKGTLADAEAFHEAFPATPMVFYGDLAARTAAGRPPAPSAGPFAAALIHGVNDGFAAIGATVLRVAARHDTEALAKTLKHAAPVAAAPFFDRLLADTIGPCRVGGLAKSLGVSAPTLRRRCAAWGFSGPRKLVALARLYHVERLARWSQKPNTAVALALHWSGRANFARSMRNELGCPPSEIARLGGPECVAERIVQALVRMRRLPGERCLSR